MVNRSNKSSIRLIQSILVGSMIFVLLLSSVISEQETTFLTITPSDDPVEKNDTFSLVISVEQSEPLIVVQIDLTFNSDLVQCDSVGNANPLVWTSFFPPTIDNVNGEIHGACVAVLGSTVSNSTDCFNISFTTLNKDGMALFLIHDILMTNGTGDQITAISTTELHIIVGDDTNNGDDSSGDDSSGSSNDNNVPPILEEQLSGPEHIVCNISYNFSIMAIDDDNDQLYYLFDWDDNSSASWEGPYQSGVLCIQDHRWDEEGYYFVTVDVKDTYGYMEEEISSLNISVQNNSGEDLHPPQVNFMYSPLNPNVGVDITFTDTSVDIDGTITKYHWDFGDNTTSAENIPIHSYTYEGVYTVTFTVWDDEGLINSTQKQIHIVNDDNTINENNDQPTPGFAIIMFILSGLMMLFIKRK